MNDQSPLAQRQSPSADTDLLDIVRLLWRGKLVIAAGIVAALILASLYLHSAVYRYTATLKLTPTESSTGRGLSSRLGALGGLASAAGINLPPGESLSPFELYIESLRSLDVAEELAADHRIMTTLFALEWDATTTKWRDPSGSLRAAVNFVKLVLGAPVYPWREPDAQRILAYLEQSLVIEESNKKAIAVLSYEHPDPVFAAYLLTAINSATDKVLRQRTLARANEYIAFLNEKLDSTAVHELRSDIADALSEQEKLVVYASSQAPFAAQSFGDPVASARPTSPKPVLVLALAIALGLFAGAVLILIHEGLRRRMLLTRTA